MTDNEKLAIAEKIRETLDCFDCSWLGGLDHISITKNVVTYYDFGMNGNTRDLRINIKKKTWRVCTYKSA